MQWIALDAEHTVWACEADKQKVYRCQECGALVKVRSGPHRQAHFYHLRARATCYQHRKSAEHLGLQLYIAKHFPPDEVRMERPFPDIGRIADVAWEGQRIVFEVQCSPISLTEAQERTRDYRSLGWQLIWILSDKRFNRRKLTAAERYLRQQTCYFASWNKMRSTLYDQWEVLSHFRRIYKGPPSALLPTHIAPLPRSLERHTALPSCIRERLEHWPLHIEGDILSHATQSWFVRLLAIEARLAQKTPRLPWLHLLKRSYLHLLETVNKP